MKHPASAVDRGLDDLLRAQRYFLTCLAEAIANDLRRQGTTMPFSARPGSLLRASIESRHGPAHAAKVRIESSHDEGMK